MVWRNGRCSRRLFLGSVAAAVGIAGCADDEPADDPDDGGDGDEREIDYDEFASHSGDSPREFPSDHVCNGVCGMDVAEYPDWNAQVAHADEMGAFFCSSGCMVGYLVAPDHVGALDTDVVGVWVTEFETGELIDGNAAYYVLEDDVDRMDEPMGLNPRPFADRADAVDYVDRYADLTEADIVGLDDFDLETARIYREHRLPEPDD